MLLSCRRGPLEQRYLHDLPNQAIRAAPYSGVVLQQDLATPSSCLSTYLVMLASSSLIGSSPSSSNELPETPSGRGGGPLTARVARRGRGRMC